jgi:NAD(P)-dependent dehydrogenase (short-subunit alcohol dehydrogenase family)
MATWFVTGASRGIGAEIARAALAGGNNVVVAVRNPERVPDDLKKSDQVLAVALDVTDNDSIPQAVEAAVDRFGGIDVLVNNAGYAYRAEIGALDVAAMRTMFETNVFGLVDITNRIVPLMKAQGRGDIVNIASTSGMKGAATATPYSASKWAVRGISQCWQAELRPHGIRVTCVCPSEVQTNFGGQSGRNNPNKLYARDIADTIMAALNMPPRALWPELAIFANNPWKED